MSEIEVEHCAIASKCDITAAGRSQLESSGRFSQIVKRAMLARFRIARTRGGRFRGNKLPNMLLPSDATLLDLLLDSWDRNNRILVNLLRALPSGALAHRALPDSPTVSEMFTHMHFVRLIFLSEDAPDLAVEVPEREWVKELDAGRLAEELDRSAAAVRNGVRTLIACGRQTKVHYDHPLLFLQHMIWHEGYHHGQIKLALKAGGQAFDDELIGPVTWDVWIDKHAS